MCGLSLRLPLGLRQAVALLHAANRARPSMSLVVQRENLHRLPLLGMWDRARMPWLAASMRRARAAVRTPVDDKNGPKICLLQWIDA